MVRGSGGGCNTVPYRPFNFALASADLASEGIFHPICELVDSFNAGCRLMQFEAHPGVSAGVKEERHLLRGRVDVVIVGELRQGEECVPVVLLLLASLSVPSTL